MRTVWKYPLGTTDLYYTLQMPVGAEILWVDAQRNQPCLWALVDTANDLEERCFGLYDTGEPLGDGVGQYIGSFSLPRGDWEYRAHVFEVGLSESG